MYRMNGAAAAPPIELEVEETAFEPPAESMAAETVWSGVALPDPLFDVDLCCGDAAESF